MWVNPPLGAFSCIWNAIGMGRGDGQEKMKIYRLKELVSYEMEPPSFLLGNITNAIAEIESEKSITIFSSLYNYEISPPEFSFESIKNEVISKTPVLKINASWYKKYASVAAIFALLIASFFVFKSLKLQKEPIANIKKNDVPPATTILPAPPITDTLIAQSVKPIKSVAKKRKRNKIVDPSNDDADSFETGNLKSENIFYSQSFSIGTDTFTLKNNDVFATFASFDPDKAPSFLLSDDESALFIKVDDFTSISISPAMRKMLKKMYQTRRNGKLTLRARREKSKLEKWRTADSTMFDATLQIMPTDPVSLSEFLKK